MSELVHYVQAIAYAKNARFSTDPVARAEWAEYNKLQGGALEQEFASQLAVFAKSNGKDGAQRFGALLAEAGARTFSQSDNSYAYDPVQTADYLQALGQRYAATSYDKPNAILSRVAFASIAFTHGVDGAKDWIATQYTRPDVSGVKSQVQREMTGVALVGPVAAAAAVAGPVILGESLAAQAVTAGTSSAAGGVPLRQALDQPNTPETFAEDFLTGVAGYGVFKGLAWGVGKVTPVAKSWPFARGGLSDAEVAFAKQIQNFKGGAFKGVPKRSAPGIDGHLNDVPVSLKETQGGLSAVLRHASQAEMKAKNAGYSGVDLYIKAPNVGREPLLEFAKKGGLVKIPNQGTIRSIYVYTADGWVPIGS